MSNKLVLEAKVSKALQKIRPYLLTDGGDVVLKDITDENIARIKLLGACQTCPISKMTMQAGVKQTVMSDVPELKDIITIN